MRTKRTLKHQRVTLETPTAARSRDRDGGMKAHSGEAESGYHRPRPNDKRVVSYALGGDDLARCRAERATWGKLRKLLLTPERTRETHAAYLSLSAEQKAKLKARPGWFGAAS